MLKALRRRATAYWQGPGVAELTPWDMADLNEGARACPRMTAVYDNSRCLMQLILMIDAFTAFAWVLFICWALTFPTYTTLAPLAVNVVVLGVMTVICSIATVKATRAERMMIVVGSTSVLGMHDDWPRLQEEPDGTDAVDVTPSPEATQQTPDSDVSVFEFPNHEDILPDDQRDVG